MQAKVHKQYLELAGRPMIFYPLYEMEQAVDEIVLVVGAGEEEFCRKEIVEKYGFRKVKKIIPGGKERYDSVYQGLLVLEDADYVLIQDGARACLDQGIISRALEDAVAYEASVVGMPSKDTIKIADADGFAENTPDRNYLWIIQTPQSFSLPIIREAYEKMMADPVKAIPITDDAMVVETYTDHKVKLTVGSYENIKVTTPEDLFIAEQTLKRRGWS